MKIKPVLQFRTGLPVTQKPFSIYFKEPVITFSSRSLAHGIKVKDARSIINHQKIGCLAVSMMDAELLKQLKQENKALCSLYEGRSFKTNGFKKSAGERALPKIADIITR